MNFEQLMLECMTGEKSQKKGNLRGWIKANYELQEKTMDLMDINGTTEMCELLRKKQMIEIEMLKETIKQFEWWILNADRLAEESKIENAKKPKVEICSCCKKIHVKK